MGRYGADERGDIARGDEERARRFSGVCVGSGSVGEADLQVIMQIDEQEALRREGRRGRVVYGDGRRVRA